MKLKLTDTVRWKNLKMDTDDMKLKLIVTVHMKKNPNTVDVKLIDTVREENFCLFVVLYCCWLSPLYACSNCSPSGADPKYNSAPG